MILDMGVVVPCSAGATVLIMLIMRIMVGKHEKTHQTAPTVALVLWSCEHRKNVARI
jgi:hypothetical protein